MTPTAIPAAAAAEEADTSKGGFAVKQRIFVALLALVMTLSLCACGGQVQPDPNKGKLPNGESDGSGESGAYDDSLDLLRQEMEGIQPYLFAAAGIGDGAGPLESDVRE